MKDRSVYMERENLTPKQIVIMSIACGAVVANLYYSQPLVELIARYYSISENLVSWIPTLTQLGYAFGLIFILPLADIVEKKSTHHKTISCLSHFSIHYDCVFIFLLDMFCRIYDWFWINNTSIAHTHGRSLHYLYFS